MHIDFKLLLPILFGLILFSCKDDEPDTNQTPPLTESLVELGIQYGSESRQFLDLYKAESECPTPIYFDAHGNGGTTFIPDYLVEDLNSLGISIIAWESLTSVNTTDEVETGWSDAELMFQWVIDNADTYNLDVSNIIIGGSSRGSILSWRYGHRENPNIKGLYMYNALPSVWAAPEWWLPTNDVTVASPPIFFVYRREPGSSTNATDPDIHDPNNGTMIVEKYESLGIGDDAELVHSIGETDNSDKYQFLVEFAESVLELCSE